MDEQVQYSARYDLGSIITHYFPTLRFGPTELIIDLLETSHELYQEMTVNLSNYGLSQGKFKILLSLLKHGRALNPSELATFTGVTRSTVTGLIDGLEQDELIRRGTEDDRRKTAIHLTDKGKQLMITVIPLYVSYTTDILAALSEEEQAQLANLLHKIRNGLEQAKPKHR